MRKNTYTYLVQECATLSKKYIKYREPVFGNITLIPQLYWGNLNYPEIIILGKNASYSIEDEYDNYFFKNELIQNTFSISNINRFFITNLLVDQFSPFILSNASRWWRKAFEDWEPYNSFTENLMDNVAIINMYGFYSEYLDTKPKEKSYLESEPEILDMIRKHIKSGKPIYIMWKKSISWWEDLLGVKFNPNTTFIVNGKNARNKMLKNSVLLSSITDAKRQ